MVIGLDLSEEMLRVCQMPEDQREIYKDHTWYLIEGTRPVG